MTRGLAPKPALVPKAPSRKDRRAAKALRRQAGTALGVGAVAVTLTALSLSHLAHGIEIVTGCQPWEGWAMAVSIDLGFVALELSQLAVTDKLRRQVSRFARPAILGTLAGLRAGFLTSAARRGASVFKMRDVSRHKSMEVLQGYVRDADMFRDHAGAGLL